VHLEWGLKTSCGISWGRENWGEGKGTDEERAILYYAAHHSPRPWPAPSVHALATRGVPLPLKSAGVECYSGHASVQPSELAVGYSMGDGDLDSTS
jgi:hypothetical protein